MNISICQYWGEPISMLKSNQIVKSNTSTNLLDLLVDTFVYGQDVEDGETSEGSLEEAGISASWGLPQDFQVQLSFSATYLLSGLRHFSDYQENCLVRITEPTSPPPQTSLV